MSLCHTLHGITSWLFCRIHYLRCEYYKCEGQSAPFQSVAMLLFQRTVELYGESESLPQSNKGSSVLDFVFLGLDKMEHDIIRQLGAASALTLPNTPPPPHPKTHTHTNSCLSLFNPAVPECSRPDYNQVFIISESFKWQRKTQRERGQDSQ